MNTTPTEETEYIRKMYESQLQSQKDTLTSNYQQALSDIDATRKTADQQLDKNLNTTAVEAQRAQKNYNEVQNAYGLSSGAMAQARLAQDNQLQADLTTLRTAHQTADAELERERALLGQQYAAAISQAQAENDMAKAQALYEEAKERDAQLTARQQSAAQLMAQVGDFSLYGQAYGLTPDQISALSAQFQAEKQKEADTETRAKQERAAALMAQSGDFSLYGQAYGLTPDQISALSAQFQAEKQKEAASLMAQSGDFSLYKQIYGLTDDQLATLQSALSGTSDTRGSPDVKPKTPVENPDGPSETSGSDIGTRYVNLLSSNRANLGLSPIQKPSYLVVAKNVEKYLNAGLSETKVKAYIQSAVTEGLSRAEYTALMKKYFPATGD